MAALPFLAILLPYLMGFLQALMPSLAGSSGARTIRFEEKEIKLSQTKYERVQWKWVRRWFLAPVPGEKKLVSLTLECGDGKKSIRRYWSIVLDERKQKNAFLTELKHLRQTGRAEAPVVELSQQMPERKMGRAGSWLMAVAFYLSIHGLPLLQVGLMPHHSHDPSESPSRFTPAQKEKAQRMMRQVFRCLHISNKGQLRTAFCVSGALLTSAAGGLFVWGIKRRKRQATELNQLYDLELAKITRPQVESDPPN